MIRNLILFATIVISMAACSKAKSEPANEQTSIESEMENKATQADSANVRVLVKTTMGDFTVMLYGDTPEHRDNFVKLANEHYYDSLLFHRVIENFMVQAGDPNSKNAPAGKMLGDGDPSYTLPAEIVFPKHYHKRGALAAARTGDQVNPERRSSGSQFYVVTGQVFSGEQMQQMAIKAAFDQLAEQHMDSIRAMMTRRDQPGLQALQDKLVKEARTMVAEGKGPYSTEMIKTYTTEGGTPHLDGQYSVFGEVIDGMDTIDKIQKAETDRNDRPTQDVRILSMTVLDK